MQNKANNVNENDDFDNISLDQDDPAMHYTIVPNALIRDATISPNCRWLIIYLISNKPGWTIKSRQLWDHTKGFIGRDLIRKVLQEAIDAGYVRRDVHLKKQQNGAFRGYNYVVSRTPKFKKCLREPEIQGLDFQCPDLQGPVSTGIYSLPSHSLLSEENSLKVHEEPKSAKASEVDLKKSIDKEDPRNREVCKKIIEAIQKVKPDYPAPKNLSAWITHIDFLLRLDKRDPQKLMDVLNWALSDSFWADKMFKPNPPKYLREKFDQLEMKMNAKPQEKRLSVQDEVLKRFKNGVTYNGAECFINEEGIAFSRGMKYKQVKFRELGFSQQLDGLLRFFDIKG